MITPKQMLENAPRDIKVDRGDEKKYNAIRDKFKLETDKQVFLLALNIGFFYNLPLKLNPNPKHVWGVSTFEDEEIKDMMTIAYAEDEDIPKCFDGASVIKICEEYANGGIKKLYNTFIESNINKEDALIIEEIVEELDKKLHESNNS
jgi:hypothetical protein